MTSRFFKKIILPTLVIATLCFGGFTPVKSANAADKSLSKADVEQIIHDYIVKNPQIILSSVDGYQRKARQTHQNTALERNKDFLFNDLDSPYAGKLDGDVTIIEFFDYNCHFCKAVFPDVQKLLKKDKKVHFVFRDLPMLGPTSKTAAKWALAAQKQKKYFEYHEALMSNKDPITDDLLEKIAKKLNMDIPQAKKDINSKDVILQLDKTRALATNIGINGVPAFIVDGEMGSGAISLERMEEMIANQRKRQKTK